MSTINDLTKQAPRSPRQRIGGYVILARCLDKGRATLNSANGDYHFNCPLDNFLFNFKDVKGEDVMQLLTDGATDEQVLEWLNNNGARRSKHDIEAWSDQTEAYRPYDFPDKREWFVEECSKVGLDPSISTLFDMLEADDEQSYQGKEREAAMALAEAGTA